MSKYVGKLLCLLGVILMGHAAFAMIQCQSKEKWETERERERERGEEYHETHTMARRITHPHMSFYIHALLVYDIVCLSSSLCTRDG